MASFFTALIRKPNACQPECNACEEACAKEKGTSRGAICAIHLPGKQYHGVIACVQCGEPSCLEVCPVGAITKSSIDGVVRISDDKCIGCAQCTVACPYGGIYYDPIRKKSYKCDTCDGKFECVEACEYGVITVAKTEPTLAYLHEEDLLAPGVGMCAGCPVEMILRFTFRVLGKDTVVFTTPGCAATALTAKGATSTLKISSYGCLMTNVPSSMTGVKRMLQRRGKDITCVSFVGDGCTADVGLQPLSGAAERGENIIYICYDNEAYMNTGIQRSSTTPLSAWTSTTPTGRIDKGKTRKAKNLPLLMVWHGISYVATASVGYLEDYALKLQKAKTIRGGTVYIHLLAPCPIGWRAPVEESLELSRLAVETNYFPLWECEDGSLRFTYNAEKSKPIEEFINKMGRFAHLEKAQVGEFQKMVDERFATIQALAEMGKKGIRIRP